VTTLERVRDSDEVRRQASLSRYGLARTGVWVSGDDHLQRLVDLTQQVLKADHAAIHIMHGDRQVRIAATAGVPMDVTSRSMSMCQRILDRRNNDEAFVTADATRHPALADNPWVTGELGAVRFYAAAPLIGREGLALGTLCAWSDHEAQATEQGLARLAGLRDAVLAEFEVRRGTDELVEAWGDDDGSGQAPGRTPSGQLAWTIDAVIERQAVRTLFQPVVHLDSGSVAGFAALSHGPMDSPLESPVALVSAAERTGRLSELDWLCRVQALKEAARSRLHSSLSWFVDVQPAGLDPRCPDHLVPALSKARTELRVVLGVLERSAQDHITSLLHVTEQARADAWGIAVTHLGADEASLALLHVLQPDVVALDMSLLQSADPLAVGTVTAAVRAYAERTGAVILAEGVETEEHERLARVFGAVYGRGPRFGAPGPLPASVPAPRHVIPLRQRPERLAGGTPFEVLSEKSTPQRAAKSHLLHISQHLEELALRLSEPCLILAGFQKAAFFSEAKRLRYTTLAEANALTVVLADDVATDSSPCLHVGPLRPGSRMSDEWVVIVMGLHHAAAFVAKDCRDFGPDSQRRFDFVYTHDRALISAAARAFFQAMDSAPWDLDPPLTDSQPLRAAPEQSPRPRAGSSSRRPPWRRVRQHG
jgi:EAL domain-containing protein (putative c-di-GMP-specific phosphodiesterase class I)